MVRENRLMMATLVEIQVPCPPESQAVCHQAIAQAFTEMERFAAKVNTWASTSELQGLNDHAGQGPVHLSAEVLDELELCQAISALTGGAFDVTVNPLLQLWFKETPNLGWPSPARVAQVKALVDYRRLLVDRAQGTAQLSEPGMSVGLGAIAKGRATDIGIASLRRSGFNRALIRSGGNIFALGAKPGGEPWQVGIQDLRNPDGIIRTLQVSNCAVDTSGDYEQHWELDGRTYSHIIDARTGYPAQLCASVTVVSPTAESADGLATALFIMGPTEGLALAKQLPNVEVLMIDSSGIISYTPGIEPLFAKDE